MESYYERNRERIKARVREYRIKNKSEIYRKMSEKRSKPEEREKARKKTKEWYAENREKALEYARIYRKERKEKIDKWFKEYQKTEKGKLREHKKRVKVRALLLNVKDLGTHSNEEWNELLFKWDFSCACCGKNTVLTKDHARSLKHGGSDRIENLQPLCRSCNARKGAKNIWFSKNKTMI